VHGKYRNLRSAACPQRLIQVIVAFGISVHHSTIGRAGHGSGSVGWMGFPPHFKVKSPSHNDKGSTLALSDKPQKFGYFSRLTGATGWRRLRTVLPFNHLSRSRRWMATCLSLVYALPWGCCVSTTLAAISLRTRANHSWLRRVLFRLFPRL
jgi:hypothetical protein